MVLWGLRRVLQVQSHYYNFFLTNHPPLFSISMTYRKKYTKSFNCISYISEIFTKVWNTYYNNDVELYKYSFTYLKEKLYWHGILFLIKQLVFQKLWMFKIYNIAHTNFLIWDSVLSIKMLVVVDQFGCLFYESCDTSGFTTTM